MLIWNKNICIQPKHLAEKYHCFESTQNVNIRTFICAAPVTGLPIDELEVVFDYKNK